MDWIFERYTSEYKEELINVSLEIKREIYSKLKEEFKVHNLVLIGLRQIGKTTLSMQLIKEMLIEQQIDFNDTNSFFYLNLKVLNNKFESIDLLNFLAKKKYKYVFIDEIQEIDRWTNFVQTTVDLCKNTKFIFTGSNASALAIETMVNRAKVYYIPTLSFNEYKLFWKDESIEKFLKYGSFPRLEKYDSVVRQYIETIDDNVIDKIIFSDYKEVVTQSKFKLLMKKMTNRIGQILSVGAIAAESSSSEVTITRPTIYNYIHLMDMARLTRRIARNNDASDKVATKLYFSDKSMIYRFNNYDELNANEEGSLIENVVFNYLDNEFGWKRSLSNDIEYFVGDNKSEIDFVIDDQKLIIEVKYYTVMNIDNIASQLNETLGKKKQDYKKIVVTKNNEGTSQGWKFVKFETLLNQGLIAII